MTYLWASSTIAMNQSVILGHKNLNGKGITIRAIKAKTTVFHVVEGKEIK